MKRITKLLALVVAVVMVAGVLCGCGGEKKSREMGRYSYWVSMDAASQQTLKKFDDCLMYQELAKKTGIQIDFIHPTAGSTGAEAFQILLTSSDMPDMVEYSWKSYPGGPDAAINNKVIISLNKYLKDYAPDYYDYMEGEKGKANDYLYKAQALTQNGNYYGFGSLNIGSYRGFGGFFVRKDLLEKYGLDVPVTIDDWDAFFAAAKADGVKYPFTTDAGKFDVNGMEAFNIAWQVGKDFHMEGDKVVFAFDKPEYKDYVKKMAEWMKKGYIDPDYITNGTEEVNAAITTGESVASFCYVGSGFGKLIPAMEGSEKIPDFELVACPYPVLNEGEEPWFQEIQGEYREPVIAITTACGMGSEDRYKEAISWCNNLYTEEGKVLKIFGVEGKTFTKTEKAPEEIGEDGEKYKYTYTDLIYDADKQKSIGAHSVEAALYHYMRPANSPGINQHNDYLDGFYPYEEQKDAIKVWNQSIDVAKQHVLPPYTLTNEEMARVNEINAKAYDKFNAVISNIILGKADISTYDAAVATAKKDGYDEIRDIYQAALDRYNSLVK